MPPRVVCGNPLFRDWLDAERKIAQDKGIRTAETYGKAVKSINACPVKYDHPSELQCLAFVGPKIVDLLTRKYRIHCEENDIEPVATPSKKPKPKAKASKAAPVNNHNESDDDDDEPAPPPKPKRKVTEKPYIPAKRSGAHGLLIALMKAIEDPARSSITFLSKPDLIRIAQPYCEASYSRGENGGIMTVWRSMKTLLDKGYVYTTGQPPKYCFTEDGYTAALSVRRETAGFENVEEHPWIDDPIPGLALAITAPARPRPAPREIPLNQAGPSQAAARSRPSLDSNRRESHPGRFQFWYIDSTGQRVPTVIQASIRLDPDDFVNLRKIEFKHAQRNHPFARQLKLVDAESRVRDDSGEATYFGFTAEEDAPPNCSKFEDPPPAASVGGSGKKRARSGDDDSDLDIEGAPPAGSRPPPKRTPNDLFAQIGSSSSFARTQSAPTNINSAAAHKLAADAAVRRMAGVGATASLSSLSTPSVKAARPAPRLSAHVPIQNPFETGTEPDPDNMPNFDPSTAIVWPAGSYEIILIIDNREVESTKSRDKFHADLLAKGVKAETRALRLGDMIWIARKLDGHGGQEDEVVLDYVVERKRLDDLCTSITDGRYTEQCFRLGNSMIQHVYYIVEDFQTAARMEAHGDKILTAKSQLQVHSKFFMKETHKLNETIDFLKTMTEVIISTHAHHDLRIIPPRYLSRTTFCALQKKLRSTTSTGKESAFLIHFEQYQALNNKTAGVTLREVFAKMMMTTRGMTAERVSSLLTHWETPRELWEDLKAHAAAPEPEPELGKDGKPKKKKVRGKEMFFSDRVQVEGDARKSIGDALSKALYKNLMGGEGVAD